MYLSVKCPTWGLLVCYSMVLTGKHLNVIDKFMGEVKSKEDDEKKSQIFKESHNET